MHDETPKKAACGAEWYGIRPGAPDDGCGWGDLCTSHQEDTELAAGPSPAMIAEAVDKLAAEMSSPEFAAAIEANEKLLEAEARDRTKMSTEIHTNAYTLERMSSRQRRRIARLAEGYRPYALHVWSDTHGPAGMLGGYLDYMTRNDDGDDLDRVSRRLAFGIELDGSCHT